MVDIVYKKKRENGWWGRIKARLSYFPPKRLVLTSLTDFNQFFSLGLTDLHCYELSRLSCSQTKLHKMVEYAGFWNVLGLVSFGGLQWEHRIFVCVLLFLFSFSATLFFFLRKGKKVTGAFELDWPHQRQWVLVIAKWLWQSSLWGGLCWVFAFLSQVVVLVAALGVAGEESLICLCWNVVLLSNLLHLSLVSILSLSSSKSVYCWLRQGSGGHCWCWLLMPSTKIYILNFFFFWSHSNMKTNKKLIILWLRCYRNNPE